MTMDFCDLVDKLRSHFFARDRDVTLQSDRVFVGAGYVPIGCILLWSGATGAIPTNWQICDGTNGTPDLRNSFVVGAGDTYAVDATGGADSVDISHTHGPGTLNTDSDAHDHDVDSGLTANDTHSHSVNYNSFTVDGGSDENVIASGSLVVQDDSHTHGPGSLNTEGDSHDHDVDSGATASGGDTTHDNRPAYYALAYIQRLS